jgi:ABC-type multidrug transport system permease subunit
MIESFWAFTTDYLRTVGANPNAISLPLRFEEIIYGSLKPAVVEFMTPGIICLTAFYATTALSGFALVLERKDGLLERSLIAGVNSSEFLISHIMAHLIILTVQMTLMLLTCFWLFDFTNNGSIVLVTVLTFLQGIAGVMFGLFISSLCDTEVSAAIMGESNTFQTIFLNYDKVHNFSRFSPTFFSRNNFIKKL